MITRLAYSELLKTTTLHSLKDVYAAWIGDTAYDEYFKNPQRPLSELLEEYRLGESE